MTIKNWHLGILASAAVLAMTLSSEASASAPAADTHAAQSTPAAADASMAAPTADPHAMPHKADAHQGAPAVAHDPHAVHGATHGAAHDVPHGADASKDMHAAPNADTHHADTHHADAHHDQAHQEAHHDAAHDASHGMMDPHAAHPAAGAPTAQAHAEHHAHHHVPNLKHLAAHDEHLSEVTRNLLVNHLHHNSKKDFDALFHSPAFTGLDGTQQRTVLNEISEFAHDHKAERLTRRAVSDAMTRLIAAEHAGAHVAQPAAPAAQ